MVKGVGQFNRGYLPQVLNNFSLFIHLFLNESGPMFRINTGVIYRLWLWLSGLGQFNRGYLLYVLNNFSLFIHLFLYESGPMFRINTGVIYKLWLW